MNHSSTTEGTNRTVRAVLLELAKQQKDLAAHEAAQKAAATPYWAACPTSILGRRAADAVLREHADNVPAAVHGRVS
jgi:hypothetical protein